MRLVSKAQEQRIIEILNDEGYELLGIGDMDGNINIAINPIDYEEISARLSSKIEDETGLKTIIRL